MANKVRIVYTDGTAQEVNLTAMASVAAERKFGKLDDAHQLEASYYMAFYALGAPGGVAGFEDWLRTVEVAEQAGEELATGNPPEADPSPEVSPL